MAIKKVTPAAATTTTKKAAPKKAAAKKSPVAKTAKAKKPAITNEDIEKKAQEIYEARIASGGPGNQESDWLNAEKALKSSKK